MNSSLNAALVSVFLLFGCTQPTVEQAIGNPDQNPGCRGTAECFLGIVYSVTDGDTIKVLKTWGSEPVAVRFSLVNTPEKNEKGYSEAKEFTEKLCPAGSQALVDEDDKETAGSYGRMVALVICGNVNMSNALLDSNHAKLLPYFCARSEFVDTNWARKYGC